MAPTIESQLRRLLQEMQDEAKHRPSRNLSLAITKLEEAIMWYGKTE